MNKKRTEWEDAMYLPRASISENGAYKRSVMLCHRAQVSVRLNSHASMLSPDKRSFYHLCANFYISIFIYFLYSRRKKIKYIILMS